MSRSLRNIAVLDANVLYPAPIRDFLLHLAHLDLYKPKWTNEIQEEWIRSLLINRPDLKKESLEKTRETMNSAFPDSNIENYEGMINSLTLPDKKDRHILAAAITAKAEVIVTFNLKDFPYTCLKSYNIEVLHPDVFITRLMLSEKNKVLQALNNQIRSLKNPPKSKDEVIAALQKCGLTESIIHLKK